MIQFLTNPSLPTTPPPLYHYLHPLPSLLVTPMTFFSTFLSFSPKLLDFFNYDKTHSYSLRLNLSFNILNHNKFNSRCQKLSYETANH